MSDALIVTNGDSAVPVLRAAGVTGPILPWRDVLHDGPVPGHLAADALRRVRAAFLAERGWIAVDAALADLEDRDARLEEHREEIILVFEHDLYDQLQLIQILARFARVGSGPSLTLACEAAYIGHLDATGAAALLERRRSVTAAQVDAAAAAWDAFTAARPEALAAAAASPASDLPFLRPALRRLLEERPAEGDGLSRTERTALEALAAGPMSAGALYRAAHHDAESPVWLGDASFAWYLDRLMAVRVPLIEAAGAPDAGQDDFWRRPLRLTEAGRAVRGGEVSHAALNGLDRWQGGVHFVQEAA